MKKVALSVSTFIALGLSIYYSGIRQSRVVIDFNTIDKKEIIKIEHKTKPEMKSEKQLPVSDQSRNPASSDDHMLNRDTSYKRRSIQEPFDPGKLNIQYSLTHDLHIVKDTYAVKRSQHSKDMGQIITSSVTYDFISSSSPIDAPPVVYNAKTQRLTPLSHLIKISDIDESQIDNLKNNGFQINQYFDHLNLAFVETKRTDYSLVFEGLKAAGYNPEVELMDRHQVGR